MGKEKETLELKWGEVGGMENRKREESVGLVLCGKIKVGWSKLDILQRKRGYCVTKERKRKNLFQEGDTDSIKKSKYSLIMLVGMKREGGGGEAEES